MGQAARAAESIRLEELEQRNAALAEMLHRRTTAEHMRHQLVDRFGQPILIGSLYTFHTSHSIPMTVVDIVPIVHQHAPPGAYRVVLSATLPIQGMSRAPIQGLQFVSHPDWATLSKPENLNGETADGADEPATVGQPADPTDPNSIVLTDL